MKRFLFFVIIPILILPVMTCNEVVEEIIEEITSMSFTTPNKIYDGNLPAEGDNTSYLLDPAMEVSTDGEIYLIWNNWINDDEDRISFGWSGDRGDTWSESKRISSGYKASISLSNSGNVNVVYPRCCPWDLFHISSSDNGTTWRSPVQITNSSFLTPSLDPKICIDNSGNMNVAWNKGNQQDVWEVYFSHSSDSGFNWSVSIGISNKPNYHSNDSSITCLASGSIYLVWQQNLPQNAMQVFFSQSDDYGVTWTIPKDVSPGDNHSEHPFITCDGSSTIYLTWSNNYHYTEKLNVFLSFSTDNGATWRTPVNVSNTANADSKYPVMAIDNKGYIYIAWMEKVSGNWEIYFKHSPDGGENWSDPVNISSNSGDSCVPVVGVDGDGTVYLVWDDDTSGKNAIYFARSF